MTSYACDLNGSETPISCDISLNTCTVPRVVLVLQHAVQQTTAVCEQEIV